MNTVRAEGIRNSGQVKSSFTKDHLGPQRPSQLRVMLQCCFAPEAEREAVAVFISLMRNPRLHMGVSNAASPMLHALTFRTYFLDLSVRCLLYLLSDSVPRCQVLGKHVPITPKPMRKSSLSRWDRFAPRLRELDYLGWRCPPRRC